MIVAIVGSRNINIPIPDGIIPKSTDYILSGGASGIDRQAREYALTHSIIIEEILPAYDLYGRRAPLVRNDIIISRSDAVFVFWDGKSSGTSYVIKKCRSLDKPCRVYLLKNNTFEEIQI